MNRIPLLTPDTAVGAAREMLSELVGRHGQVGDMVRAMANSPAVLGGYLQLSRAMSEPNSIAGSASGSRLAFKFNKAAEPAWRRMLTPLARSEFPTPRSSGQSKQARRTRPLPQ
jgi:hypothetical protein